MTPKNRPASLDGEVLENAKEHAKIERNWRRFSKGKRRTVGKHYKYVEELALLQAELIKL